MIILTERMGQLCVGDAMTRNVLTITANSTMAEAADELCQHQVTGAPVVDEQGCCVGVLSGSDFIRLKAEELEGTDVRHVLSTHHPEGLYSIDDMGHDLVCRRMSSAVQTISENTSLLTAARCLCNEHIHRLVVLDKNNKPVGVLSSLDLVATLIAIVEEKHI
ncbi:CBS domain-containing protein [Bythopirellula polymerisocia]|jgi:CBS-domain-containing membrane protein|uniref:D-arabinose 5-phosphate isomerase n=1 Tax=Bythopirellula polymerisocia TaxID=2528003 RepID=A0A5C6D1N2_9BACT|nr:CBS domain-containing protein [Bythopirellula polymerisocia]TWU29744.1 D-arabinose 5-phosphate isomerase [Bythopirellula polymerisocia]